MCKIVNGSIRPVSSSEKLLKDVNGETRYFNKGEIYGWMAVREEDRIEVPISEYDPRVQEYLKKHMDTGDIIPTTKKGYKP